MRQQSSYGKRQTLHTKRSSVHQTSGEDKLHRVDSSGTEQSMSRSRSRLSKSMTRSHVPRDYSSMDFRANSNSEGTDGPADYYVEDDSPTKQLRRGTVSIGLVEQKLSPERQAIHKQIGGRIIQEQEVKYAHVLEENIALRQQLDKKL